MGAYLPKPVTDKISSDEYNNNLSCGTSSMQGWRVYQEDAHNAILSFDENKSLFAVYDGHGGHEVATYSALELPKFIKKTESYSEEQFSQALRDAFLEFDATLIEPEVLCILKDLAGMKDQDDSDYDGEEIDHLCREAAMPLEEVMAKYSDDSSQFISPNVKNSRKQNCSSSPVGCSSKYELNEPLVEETSKLDEYSESTCNTIEADFSSLSKKSDKEIGSCTNSGNSPPATGSSGKGEATSSLCNGVPSDKSSDSRNGASSINGNCGTIQINGNSIEKDVKNTEASHDTEMSIKSDLRAGKEDAKDVNGDLLVSETLPCKGKGKGKAKGKGILNNALFQAMNAVRRNEMKRKAAEKAELFYKQIQGGENDPNNDDEEEDDDDEEDDSFEDEDVLGYECNSSSDDSDNKDEEEEEEEEYDNNHEEDDDKQYHEFSMGVREEPGYDSGCTACVALLNGNDLYVGNVGDSRCVICRDGKALDMSVDHKPEDEPEVSRIIKAGGRITSDGRVNGGLNLSRALGDHSYKQNKNQRPEEQMISPLPDVRSISLTPKDSFMVVACDGIWNSLTSQEVCDFVSERIETRIKLSTIAEEMFDKCLSPDAHGDGTGCDNMTCIIVKFNDLGFSSEGGKRVCEKSEDNSEDTPQEKRARLEAQ